MAKNIIAKAPHVSIMQISHNQKRYAPCMGIAFALRREQGPWHGVILYVSLQVDI